MCVFVKNYGNASYCRKSSMKETSGRRLQNWKAGLGQGNGEWGPERWGWGDWVRVEGERERVHWSELGHQGRVGKEDEKERERGNEKRRELFTEAVTASCYCLPEGRIEDLW